MLHDTPERLEKARRVTPAEAPRDCPIAAHYSKPVSPTEPASIWMGLVGLGLGVAAMVGPLVAAKVFSLFTGAIFLLSPLCRWLVNGLVKLDYPTRRRFSGT